MSRSIDEVTGDTLDVYRSESLAAHFPAKRFGKGQPGDITVRYRMGDGDEVTVAHISLGSEGR